MGYITSECYDKNGKRHGEWLTRYDNNQLAYRVNFVQGVLHGLQEGYFIDNTLWYRGYRNMGRCVGYWYFFTKKEYFLCLI